ncbi:MAG: transglycosylase SLT domain-containing protein [Woeseia sp.]
MHAIRRIDLALVLVAAAFSCGFHPAASAASVEEQRAAFREVYAEAELGNWAPAAGKESLLKGYVLWPDLRAAWLRVHLDAPAEIHEFLGQYGMLKPARELRYRFALHLAASERFPEYLEIYRSYYQGLDIAKLDCLALHARILAGGGDDVANRARKLWLVGKSQADECDPVFDYLRGAGLLDEQLYRERFELAIADREFSLARYLSRSLDERFVEEADRWIAARDSADAFLHGAGEQGDGDTWRRQLVYAIERLTYDDALLASDHWQNVRTRHAFTPQQAADLSRHIALWAARQHRPEAFDMLRDLSDAATDTEVARWLVRCALRQRAWQNVIKKIEELPEDERQDEEWQYWRAIALKASGETAKAATILETLAAERSYYGFLAADELDLDYAWSHTSMDADNEVLHNLERLPALVRARELYFVGLESRGRSEWDDAVSLLQADEKAQASILAHRWNWHSRAIATAASVGRYDDLEIRYPLPYREQFEAYSANAQIPYSWAYGVARSESLFMTDIRSMAGAVGVMQLMPETGRRTAAEINLLYAGLDTLTDPDSNIRLGTHYLGKMLQRFGDNRVLATAAYNAGPLRVEKWLPDSERLDARIWIENIPYNETRAYVRGVLANDAIFHWRLTGEMRRLSADLNAIDPGPTQLLADAERETGLRKRGQKRGHRKGDSDLNWAKRGQ